MKTDTLINRVGAWLKGTGKDSDIVISSRIRLARNLNNFIFLTKANQKQKQEIASFITEQIKSAKLSSKLYHFDLKALNSTDKSLLIERHLISKDLAESNGDRSVIFNSNETWSIMVNEEDHLRIQGLRSGFQLNELWDQIDKLDTKIEKRLPYAFSNQFGYLTACPTNVGTGLRISVMLHLPALGFAKQVEKVFQALSRIKYTVRGFYGEGTQALGDFYQISNLITLGRSEKEILSEMQNVIPEIIKYERTWRDKLLKDQTKRIEDRVFRAYGILKNARIISSNETMELLSAIRLGIYLNLIKDLPIKGINQLFILTQPAHLQKIAKKNFSTTERDEFRASFIRKKISG